MAVIKPFKALRPSKKSVELVASVPYDVVNREEAKVAAGDNMLSFLRVSRAEITLDDKVNPYSDAVYKKAKENFDELIKNAPLTLDEKPYFYIYQLEMNKRTQTGIAAVFSVDDYENNIILKHEKTRKEKEDDRTNHIISTEAQTGPVFLTYRGVVEVNSIIKNITNSMEPEYNFTASDGIRHTIWIVPESFNENIIESISAVKHLYIADGHHRAASAARARKVKQEKNPNHTGKEEYNYFLAVLFAANELKILPYNRIVYDLNSNSKEEFLNKVSEKFYVEKTELKEPSETKSFCMYLDGQWYLLKARDSISASIVLSRSVSETLDASILQNFLLNPVLGISDPRTDKRIDFVGGIRGTKELESLVDSGKAAVAFSMYPVRVDDLMRVSDAGEVMPPKSTWFEPKLRDGLLIHLI